MKLLSYSRPQHSLLIGAFTLIELLTVVAIIALLAALVFPVVSRMQLAGKQASSVSRLRQLQTGNIQYANDNGGMYVPVSTATPTGNMTGAWMTDTAFMKYFVDNPNNYWWGNFPEFYYSPLITKADRKVIGMGYGYNIDGLPWFAPDASGPQSIGRTLASVPRPATLLAFAESQGWLLGQDQAKAYRPGPEVERGGAVAYRYQNKANIVFFDAHVELLSMEQVSGNRTIWIGEE